MSAHDVFFVQSRAKARAGWFPEVLVTAGEPPRLLGLFWRLRPSGLALRGPRRHTLLTSGGIFGKALHACGLPRFKRGGVCERNATETNTGRIVTGVWHRRECRFRGRLG